MCFLGISQKPKNGLSDQLKSGQGLSLQNRPMEGAGDVRFFYSATRIRASLNPKSCVPFHGSGNGRLRLRPKRSGPLGEQGVNLPGEPSLELFGAVIAGMDQTYAPEGVDNHQRRKTFWFK